MKKYISYTLLFLTPFILVTIGILFYFKFFQVIRTSKIIPPKLPSISFNDLVKFSRFSLEKAPSQSLVGNINSLTGTVLFESRLATESAKIDKPQEVQQGEELATLSDGSLNISFKDAVEINIYNNSNLSIIQTLPNNLVFWQKMGSIDYKKLGQIPLTIRVGHLLIEINGELNISFTKDSPITTVSLTDGTAIIAFNDLANNSQVLNLTTGQILEFNEATRKSKVK